MRQLPQGSRPLTGQDVVHREIDNQPAAVLRHGIAREIELGGRRPALPEQPRLRVGNRGMRGVTPALAVEIHALVVRIDRSAVVIVLAAYAFERSQRLDQGPVDREVLLLSLLGINEPGFFGVIEPIFGVRHGHPGVV
ncbi:MAG TPA: hypothetical protein VF226_16285 [Hyphomicrobiaceae bacterium]